MEATPSVAWVGACSGIASLAWNIYTKMTSGPRLKITAISGMKQWPPPPGDPTYLSVIVRNTGTATTTLTNLSLHIYDSYWKRKRQKASSTVVVVNFINGKIPFKLEVGSEWTAFMAQDEKFNELLASNKLWCGIWHSFSTKPIEVKVATPIIQGKKASAPA